MSKPSATFRRSRLAQLAALTVISFGIVLSFAWAAFLGWLILRAVSGLI